MSQDAEKVFDALLRKRLSGNFEAGKTSTECPDENRVSAYLEGALASDLRMEFERHASRCARCQDELSLLLKSKDAAARALPSPDVKRDWFTTFQSSLARFTNMGLKPALAILVVTVISGYVGYELLQRESERKAATTEMAQSMPESQRSSEEARNSHPSEETKAREAENNKVGLKTVKKPYGAEGGSASHSAVVSKDAGQGKSVQDAFSPEQPRFSQVGTAPSVGSKSEVIKGERDQAEPPSAPLPAAPPSVAERKTEPVNPPTSSLATGKLGADSSQPTPLNQPVLTGAKPAADEEAQPEADFRAKEASLRKAKVDGLSVGGQASAKKMNREDSARLETQSAEGVEKDKKQRQIRVAGKTFELRDNVWTDLSIGDRDEKMAEVIIDKNSSNYSEQIKPLAAYQAVLSLDEECLIEHEGKIYHVRSLP